jgi:elongation factor Ts
MIGCAFVFASIVSVSHSFEVRKDEGDEHQLAMLLFATNPTLARKIPLSHSLASVSRASASQMIDMPSIKKLRETTGLGMMVCKKALEDAEGDYDQALKDLRQKGLAKAEKRSGKATSQGLIIPYIHPGSKLGVLLEVNCETDFVASSAGFQEFAANIAMQIAADPQVDFISEDAVDQAWVAKEKEVILGSEDMKGKPADIAEKMTQGRINKIVKERVLMEKDYIMDPTVKVDEYLKQMKVKFGEEIKLVRFTRYTLGDSA